MQHINARRSMVILLSKGLIVAERYASGAADSWCDTGA
jgi:hypothetical protein